MTHKNTARPTGVYSRLFQGVKAPACRRCNGALDATMTCGRCGTGRMVGRSGVTLGMILADERGRDRACRSCGHHRCSCAKPAATPQPYAALPVAPETVAPKRFEVGDRVRCVGNYGSKLLVIGDLYTVLRVTEPGDHEQQVELGGRLSSVGFWRSSRFELVSRANLTPAEAAGAVRPGWVDDSTQYGPHWTRKDRRAAVWKRSDGWLAGGPAPGAGFGSDYLGGATGKLFSTAAEAARFADEQLAKAAR